MRTLALLLLAGGSTLLTASCAAPGPARQDPDRAGDEAVRLLQELVRFDTINPPQPGSGRAHADETALLRHVKKVLAADGIASEIHESAPGRGNLVARLKGTGRRKPVLLMAHVDVVNVDPARWTVDPLSGEIRDGFLWGRGALDDKDDAAVFVQALRVLAREGAKLERDVILMLNADEESSGRFGADWMVRQHWEAIACEFVLNEGGSCMLRDGEVVQYGFETAEKVYNDFRLWVRGESGHSSVPLPKNAIYDAARLLRKLEAFQTPVRLIDTTRASFAAMAGMPVYAEWKGLLEKVGAGDLVAAAELAKEPRFNAQLRSTFVPTLIKGGIRENVLPPDVEINFNVRLLPGDRIDDLLKALMAHLEIGRYEVVEGGEPAVLEWKRQKKDLDAAIFLTDRGVDAPATPADTDMYRALVAAAKKLTPRAVAMPRMTSGATDSRFFRMKGVACYGISPCPVGEAEEKTPHDHNERVRVDSVKFGVRFILEVLREIGR